MPWANSSENGSAISAFRVLAAARSTSSHASMAVSSLFPDTSCAIGPAYIRERQAGEKSRGGGFGRLPVGGGEKIRAILLQQPDEMREVAVGEWRRQPLDGGGHGDGEAVEAEQMQREQGGENDLVAERRHLREQNGEPGSRGEFPGLPE